MRYLLTLGLLLWAVSASAFTVNGKTLATWNGKTLASWNGVTAAPVVDYFATTNEGWTISVFAGGEAANPSSTAAVATVTAGDGADVGGTHNTSGTQNAVKGVQYAGSFYDGEDTVYYRDGILLQKTVTTLGSGNITGYYKIPAGGWIEVFVGGNASDLLNQGSIIYDNQWHQFSAPVGLNSGSNKLVEIYIFANRNFYTDDPGDSEVVWLDDITLP